MQAAKKARFEDDAARPTPELDLSAEEPDPGLTAVTESMIKEEESMLNESNSEVQKQQTIERKNLKNVSKKDKVERLEFLLEKSIAYSAFLANKIKKEGEGAVAVSDGTVTGPGLPQPKLIQGKMRPYQLVGVHWMVGLYENGLNGILGDEMGLGKTIQTIALLAHLREKDVSGPFLVVGPLSCLQNWHNEFARFAPGLKALIYHGSKDERARLRGAFRRKGDKDIPVMITSYEIIIRDVSFLKTLAWKFVIIDEGHRLKNMNCRLLRELKLLGQGGNRLLLTGTPLQNNLTELWSLLNFLLPDIFDDLDSFQLWFDFDFSKENNEERVLQGELQHSVVTKLHQILRPFLLRRLKQDVELEIPSKKEYILFASLSEWQMKQYQDILDRNMVDSQGQNIKLSNVLMQLRKCCNHPYLFDWPLNSDGHEAVDEVLVQASGKMLLLDRLVTRLMEEGAHKMLIFSQMTRVLDILEEYCGLRKLKYCRLDGSVSAEDRISAMNEFQKEGSDIDVFLLSTRAGGLGVNLVAADTCIIFDSDWNPHMDLQAQDRCHRIGQKKRVMVYRLAACGTVEEKILEKARDKLKLEQLVVSRGKFKDIGKATEKSEKMLHAELQDLLDFDPAKSALGSDNKVITDDELSQVLDRSDVLKTGKGFKAVEKTTSAFDAAQKDADVATA